MSDGRVGALAQSAMGRTMPKARHEVYRQAGVDTTEADVGLVGLVDHLKATWPPEGMGRVLVPIGFFATVIDIGGQGIAMCTDGVGSKTMIASLMDVYDTIGIDCVAMNVNDMICVGARPVSMVDYLSVQRADAAMITAIGKGLREGAKRAGISIPGGETAQLKDIVTGFDLVGMAVGHVELDHIITGKTVAPGDIVIGVKSNGVHSNGLTLARQAFFDEDKFKVDHKFADLELTIGEELLRPTDIYVPEAMAIVENVEGVKALINITSDGLLNLARVEAEVGFDIDDLIEPHPIFELIERYGNVPISEMFEVFNMGVGFCYIVAPDAVSPTLSVLKHHGREAQVIGRAVADSKGTVRIPQRGLEGRKKAFWPLEKSRRRLG
jgi:phosphoribosylformylglycinamidine cyclo-ligase